MEIITVKKLGTDFFLLNGTLQVPKDPNNTNYKEILGWVENGGIVEPEFTAEELLIRAKTEKLAQLEINYQHFVDKPFKATSKLIENGIPTNKDVEYLFDCETKEDSKRDPSAICFATLLNFLANKDALIDEAFETSNDFATFKQIIINGNKELANKVFTPYITKDLAGNKIVAMFNYQNAKQLALHIGQRLSTALTNKNKIIADINNAKTIEELEAININF